MPDILINPVDGLNRVDPIQKMGNGQCRKLQNLVAKDGKLSQIKGSTKYNTTALPDSPSWIETYYGIDGDKSLKKNRFCYSATSIYLGNDGAGTWTAVQSGLSTNVKPESVTIQVSDQSVMYLFTGKDVPYYYDGNAAGVWYKSAITHKLVQGVEWLDRLWSFEYNSSSLLYSVAFKPDNFTDSTDAGEIIIGLKDDSVIKRLVIFRDYLYIFKSDGIYYIEGRTPTSFSVRKLTDKYGLANQTALCTIGKSIIFLNSFNNEIYAFGGTEESIKLYSREIDFSSMINQYHIDDICCIEHDGLFRMAYRPIEPESDTLYNACEVVFPTTEFNEKGLPKWSVLKGSNVSCYSVWNKQGDNNQLMTGRSDAGYVMYHNRGYDWDSTAMECECITKDFVPDTKFNAIFDSFYIDGKPAGNRNITLKYYIGGYIASGTSVNYNVRGDVQTLGQISISKQIRFNDRIVPLTNENKGNSIAIGLSAALNNLGLEIYSITIPYELDDIIE